MARRISVVFLGMLLPTLCLAQSMPRVTHPPHPPPPGEQGSPNIRVLSHIPLGAPWSVSDIELEQDLTRPFAYVARRVAEIGFDVIDLSNPERARVIYRWRIEDPDLHIGGAMDGRYFKHNGRFYYVQSLQLQSGSPGADVGAVIFDVTGLPDATNVREVTRIRQTDPEGGFHNIFVYKHSNGLPLLFATSGAFAKVFDLSRLVESSTSELDASVQGEDFALVGEVPIGDTPNPWSQGYHDMYVGYHPESGQDRFYGAGGSGFYVFDVSNLQEPKSLARILDVPGVSWGHTFTPTSDGRYAVAETEFQYQPLRIFDLQPALDGEVDKIDYPVGAWQADWKTLAHNHEVRWPFVFVAGYETGLSVFNMENPADPYTVAYYDTFDGPHNRRSARRANSPYTWGVYDGAWGVDVRNADGLIVVSDMTTGFWAFRLDRFDGWSGEQYGVPDVSSAQKWDTGPAPTARKPRP